MLERAGIRREDAFVMNAMRCRPTDSPPSPTAINACRERMVEQVLAHPRKVILAFGNSALRGFTGDHSYKMTSARGKAIDLEEIGILVPTFHPASVLRNKGEWKRWLDDVRYAGRLLASEKVKSPGQATAWIILDDDEAEWDWDQATGDHLPTWPRVKVERGILTAVKAVKSLLEQRKLALDIETGWSMSPRIGRVLCLSVSWEKNKAVVFSEGLMNSGAFRPWLRRLLAEAKGTLVWHNGKYDSEYYLGQMAINARVDDDTMLLHYCIDETKGTHGLKDLARDFLGADDYKKEVTKYALPGDKGYENVPPEVLYPYAAMDTDNTFQLYDIFAPQVEASRTLTKLYRKLLLPASDFLRQVERYGIWIDQEFMGELEKDMRAKFKEAEKNLKRAIVGLWDTDDYMASQWATKKPPKKFNGGNFRHVRFVLGVLGLDPVNTTESALRNIDQDVDIGFRGYKTSNFATRGVDRRLEIKNPFIAALIDYRRAKKAISSHIDGMRSRLEPDGRIHGTFNLHTTETGRLSSTNPNFQNLPTPEKEDSYPIRNLVAAPPGRKIIELDYSQVELRLLAHFSGDKFLSKVYADGRDLHTEVAIAIYGKDYTEYQRVRAKALNFGIAYGRGADSLSIEYKIPFEEAKEIRRKWFENAKEATEFLKECHAKPQLGQTMTTVFGRRRRFGVVTRDNLNNLQNEAANFPMQSTASDLNLYSAMKMRDKWNAEGTDAHVVCLVHDAILLETSDELATRVEAEAKAIMEEVPVRILKPSIPFTVDSHIGTHWGDLKARSVGRRMEIGKGTRHDMLRASDQARRTKGKRALFQGHEA